MAAYLRTFGASTTPLDRDGIAAAQNPAASTALTLNGALVTNTGTANAAEFVGTSGRAHEISLYSGSNHSGLTYTVVGFADHERNYAISEDVTGPNAGYVVTTLHYAVVTSITPDGALGSDVEVGLDADGTDSTEYDILVPLDYAYHDISVQATATGTITAAIGVTSDPIYDGTVKPHLANYVDISGLDAVSANSTERGTIHFPATCLRARVSACTASEGLELVVIEAVE